MTERDSHREQSWCYLCKRVPPKSVVQPRHTESLRLQHARFARTPPSTFLFLHLHLSNSPGRKPQLSIVESENLSIRRQTPTEDYRLGLHASQWRASKTRQHAKAKSQGIAALSGRVIGPSHQACQRLSSINRHTPSKNQEVQKTKVFRAFTPHLGHNPASFWRVFHKCFGDTHTKEFAQVAVAPSTAVLRRCGLDHLGDNGTRKAASGRRVGGSS